MVDTGAVIQGVVAALVLVALIVFYIDRMSQISDNLESISDSVSDVHEDLQAVDLKDMEKTNNKLESFLDARLSSQFNGASNRVTGGQNSVVYRLGEVDLDVTISYIGDPEWHGGLREREEWDGNDTIVAIEFGEEVDTQGLVGLLAQNEELSEREQVLFQDGEPTRMVADSPFKMTISIPTSDMGKVSVWVSEFLDETESHIKDVRDLRQEFDEEVASELPGPSEIV